MSEYNEIDITTGEVDAILPEGWGEGDDFFADPGTWSGAAAADERQEATEQVTGADPEGTEVQAAPTTEQPAAGDVETPAQEDPAPTTGQEVPAEEHKMLRFRAKIDREDLEVELPESELPTVYQKSQNLDRMSGRIAEADERARALGFEDVRDMLSHMEAARTESEVKRLTDDGVHEELARDLVQRKLADRPAETRKETEPTRSKERDYSAELQQLKAQHPELTALPNEVVQEAAEGKNVLLAYAQYEARQAKAQAEALRRENEIYKQNAAAAAKAPVKGTVGGGAANDKGEDLFLRGFDSEY